MKNLILCAISFLFLFTSCFETTDEVSVVPEEPPTEEGNVMECKQVQDFINKINSYPVPREGEDRAFIEKYKYNNKMVYYIKPTGNYWTDDAGIIIDGKCNIVCKNSQVYEERDCLDWRQKAVFVEIVWKDNR